jgi:hypothetical protein
MIAELKTAVMRRSELVVTLSYVYASVLIAAAFVSDIGKKSFTQWIVNFEDLKAI